MDISRFLVKVPILFKLRDSYSAFIDGKEFSIILSENSFRPSNFVSGSYSKSPSTVVSSGSESGWSEIFS